MDNDFDSFSSPAGSGERGNTLDGPNSEIEDSHNEAETAEDRAFNRAFDKRMEKHMETFMINVANLVQKTVAAEMKVVAAEMKVAIEEIKQSVPDLVRSTLDEELKKRNL